MGSAETFELMNREGTVIKEVMKGKGHELRAAKGEKTGKSRVDRYKSFSH